MVAAGATCLATSAVSLPTPHCQAVLNNANKMAMNAAMVDQLRQRLLLFVENDDLSAANQVIEQLENATLSKEILEATRIGRYVNDVRKQTAERWPDFSKRCRAIIKHWQKLVEYRPSSSCEGSSNGGTPQLISPALRRGLTPRTPGKPPITHQQRITSAELLPPGVRNAITSSTLVSPALENGLGQHQPSGSYAPLPSVAKKISPQIAAIASLVKHVHKSASMGAALSSLVGQEHAAEHVDTAIKEPLVNGEAETSAGPPVVEPPDHNSALAAHQPPLTLKLKRSASGVQRLTTSSSVETSSANEASPPVATQQSSVQAARKNVQSTAELMAQLSEQLPQHIGGIFAVNKERQQKSEMTFSRISPALQTQPPGTINANSNEATTGRKRRKVADETSTQEHKMEEESTTIANNMSEQLIQTSMASTSSTIVEVKSEEQPKVKRKRGRPKKSGVDEPMLDATPTGTATKSTAKFNWFTRFPLTEEGQQRQSDEIPEQVYQEPDHSFVLPIHQRNVLLLPYLDIGRPDWMVHNLPEQERFIFPDPCNWPSGSRPPK